MLCQLYSQLSSTRKYILENPLCFLYLWLILCLLQVLNDTGDQDLCYFNFLCAHPLGDLTDFNHVYSNLGYVLLGLLFIINTARRDVLRRQAQARHDRLEKVNLITIFQEIDKTRQSISPIYSFMEFHNTMVFFTRWEQH